MRILDDETGTVLSRISVYLTHAELDQLATLFHLLEDDPPELGWHHHLDSDAERKSIFLGLYEPDWDAGERWNLLFREDRWEHGPITSD